MALLQAPEPAFWTFNIGNLVTILVFLGGLLSSHQKWSKEFNRMKFKLDLIWSWFESDMIVKTKRSARFVVPEEED